MSALTNSLLGWTAGLLVMSSALPNIVRNLREQGPARPSMLRDATQLAGNCLWAAYGYLTQTWPVMVMCAVSACFMAMLIHQQLRKTSAAVPQPVRHPDFQPHPIQQENAYE